MDKQEAILPSVASWARIWSYHGPEVFYSEVYTFAMPKIVHVQVHGVPTPLTITADEVKEDMSGGIVPHRLKLILSGKPVGEFKYDIVDGWWIEDKAEFPKNVNS